MAQIHTVPDLQYPYDALEPYISRQIMILHHDVHHRTYVDALNKAEQDYINAQTAADRNALIPIIKFNKGGHVNHSDFWKILSPKARNGGKLLENGELIAAINAIWGSFGNFKTEFNATTKAVQGSGWGWLGYNTDNKALAIVTTGNQDELPAPWVPIIGIDVWEHAYYPQYLSDRGEYLNTIWEVVNFEEAENRLKDAKGMSK